MTPYRTSQKTRENAARYRAKHRDAIRTRRAGQNDKIRADARARYHRDPAKHRDTWLRGKYGISQADYDSILATQCGGCAVCGTTTFGGPGKRPHIDHDHKTGKVRGLVCIQCNILLGMAQEQTSRFRAAIAYVAKHAVDIAPLDMA